MKSISRLKCDETRGLQTQKSRGISKQKDERSRGKRQFFCGFIIRLAGGGNLLKPALSKTGSRSLTLCPAPMAANSIHLKRWRALKNEHLSISILVTRSNSKSALRALRIAPCVNCTIEWLYFGFNELVYRACFKKKLDL